ncbi:MAG: ABC transporter substrate-binding protein [Phycisphaerae bacterium]|nr:ABC transporter substrate-binding protein [Phycisphaerae bacterium]
MCARTVNSRPVASRPASVGYLAAIPAARAQARRQRRLAHGHGLLVLLLALAASVSCHSERTSATPASSPVPQRIITLAPNAAEIIAALGEAERLVAVSSFCVYPPELRSLPRIGGLFDPDIEGILRLGPDLLVLRGRSETLERLCADRSIRLYHDPTESLDDVYTTIRELGALLDRREAAEALEREMRDRLDRIAAAVADRPRPRVFMTIARKPDSLAGILTASRGTFVHEIIARAGGENVFADLAIDYPQISPEAILAARPDVIVEAMPEAEPDPTLTKSARRLWRQLGPTPAARNGRVYILTDDNALIPSPRVVNVIAHLAHLLHPEADLD